MKISALILAIFIGAFGQLKAQYECITEATPENIEYLTKTRKIRQNYSLTRDKAVTTINYVPIQLHIVRQSNGTGGLTNIQLDAILDSLNKFYINANMYFFECGGRNYIDDSGNYNFSSSNESSFCGANDVSNVINIYLFNSATSGNTPVCGYSRFPPSVDRVIMVNSCALNYSTLPHELGHYFSLYHTHGKTNTGTTTELVNGSNCTTDGDDVCDTPADPNLSGVVNSSCQYTGTLTDLNNMAYVPDPNMVMSYSLKQCRDYISPLQYARVASSLALDRNYLVCNTPPAFAQFDFNVIDCIGNVSFSDFSTNGATSWVWDFGDGSPTSTAQNPSHNYSIAGSYTVTLTATNNNGATTVSQNVIISFSSVGSVALTTPNNGATNVGGPYIFNWNTVASALTYDIDISTDAGFSVIVDNAIGLTTNTYTSNLLLPFTTYYWRVRAVNNCGNGNFQSVYSLTTGNCNIDVSVNVPIVIPSTGTPTVTSTINVGTIGTITDVNVVGLKGTHTWISDLQVTLTSPQNTTIILWDQVCFDEDDFDLNFDDAASLGTLPCPPVGGLNYQPQGLLSAFNGENPFGNWVLTINDLANADGGALSDWSLSICLSSISTSISEINSSLINVYPNPNKGFITVKLPTFQKELNYMITTLDGRIIASEKLFNKEYFELNMEENSVGIYFLKVYNDSFTSTVKLIKE